MECLSLSYALQFRNVWSFHYDSGSSFVPWQHPLVMFKNYVWFYDICWVFACKVLLSFEISCTQFVIFELLVFCLFWYCIFWTKQLFTHQKLMDKIARHAWWWSLCWSKFMLVNFSSIFRIVKGCLHCIWLLLIAMMLWQFSWPILQTLMWLTTAVELLCIGLLPSELFWFSASHGNYVSW